MGKHSKEPPIIRALKKSLESINKRISNHNATVARLLKEKAQHEKVLAGLTNLK